MIKEFNKERVDKFWNDGLATKSWLRGYIEGNCSFGIYINLRSVRKKKYLDFKPSIKIIIKDKDTIDYIKKELDLSTNITQEKQTHKSLTYFTDKLHLQKSDDIDKIIELFNDKKFISKNKQGIFDRFKDAYLQILKMGGSWKSYDKNIDDFINNYLPIQEQENYCKRWISKIKEHFSGDDE